MQKNIHTWLKDINVVYHPGTTTPLLDKVAAGVQASLKKLGHTVQERADASTDLVLTTARFGEVLDWRKALMFTGRITLKIKHTPKVVTLVQITPEEYDDIMAHFERALAKEPYDPKDFNFDGLASASAPDVLVEQGRRGGPILSLLRVLQAQLKCIRVLLVVGDEEIERVYHFDLVGAHPSTEWLLGAEAFFDDIVLRMVTYESTFEITNHEVVGDLISLETWQNLPAVAAMRKAGQEIGKRNFFTNMLKIVDLVPVPAVSDAIADQYSEGCFSTWAPEIDALVATITGSARPVDKGNITDNDLAAIVGIRADGMGAQVRHVDGKENSSPSSEAVEMIDMDLGLPRITLGAEWGTEKTVPVVRSKLHGHRGVRAYNPELVEFVPLDAPFYDYLVSCATEAQARAIKSAFGRAECLNTPDDPRQVAFTILPGHGIMIAEKWVAGKQPFQVILEFMDSGNLAIDNLVPQGRVRYEKGGDGRMELVNREAVPLTLA